MVLPPGFNPVRCSRRCTRERLARKVYTSYIRNTLLPAMASRNDCRWDPIPHSDCAIPVLCGPCCPCTRRQFRNGDQSSCLDYPRYGAVYGLYPVALVFAHLSILDDDVVLHPWHRKPEQLEIEADVLAWLLANATTEEALEEAVKAVAGANANRYTPDALDKYGANSEWLTRCLKIILGLPIMVIDQIRVEAYLYAVLRIVKSSTQADQLKLLLKE